MRTLLLLLLLVPTLHLSSCVFLRSAAVPMPAVGHPAPAEKANGLIVMLPGMGDGPSNYETNGFIEIVQAANPRFDVICADAHFGYYKKANVVARLHTDLIAAAAPHYEHVWLVGISLGGLGAVAYAIEHPDVVDGMILLAPFMGNDSVIAEVRAAGGPCTWIKPKDTAQGSDDERDTRRRYHELWTWYHDVIDHPATMPKLFLGYGDQDSFAKANSMVAVELPPQQTLTTEGEHNWTVWRQLFAELAPRALQGLR